MSNTATINRGGDLLSLTAQRGGTVLVSLHSVNPAGHLTGLSVPGAQLRAALDEVAPAGSYTRTDEDWKARAEKAEQERDHLATVLATTARQRDEADKRNAHTLTPDAITDEMRGRARKAAADQMPGSWWGGTEWWRYADEILTAALTEPTRPEGAERWETWLSRLDYLHDETGASRADLTTLANDLASEVVGTPKVAA